MQPQRPTPTSERATGTPRLAKLHPRTLDADQRGVYDAIAGGRRASGPKLFQLVDEDGGLEGPFNAFLLQPRVGDAMQALGAAIRYETALSDRARELAILVVAGHWGASYARYAHEAIGRHAGLTETELVAARDGLWDTFDGVERVVVEAAHRLATDGDLDDAAYSQVVDTLGEPGLFELLTLVGYYATLALQMRVFRVSTPDS